MGNLNRVTQPPECLFPSCRKTLESRYEEFCYRHWCKVSPQLELKVRKYRGKNIARYRAFFREALREMAA